MNFTPTLKQLQIMEKHALQLAKKAKVLLKEAKTDQEKELTPKGRKLLAYVKAHFSDGHWKGLGKILATVVNDPALEVALSEKDNDDGDGDEDEDGDERYTYVKDVFNPDNGGIPAKGLAMIMDGFDDDFVAGELTVAVGPAMENEVFKFDRTDSAEEFCYAVDSYMTKRAWRPATEAEIKANFKVFYAALKKRPVNKLPANKLPW